MEHPNVGADRNLFIQTGELNNQHHEQREPVVDGGNDNLVNNLPMHRLVLGESDPPNQRVITGSNSEEQRSEAVGSEDQIITSSGQQQQQSALPVPPTSLPVLPEAERSETVGSASVPPPPPLASLFPAIIPSQRRSITPDEQRSEAAGSATFPALSSLPPPPFTAAPPTVSFVYKNIHSF